MEGKCCIDCIDHAIGDKDFCGFPKCTCHFKKKDTWEERFEEESPLALGGRAWAKSFIASEITKAEDESRKLIEAIHLYNTDAIEALTKARIELLEEVDNKIRARMSVFSSEPRPADHARFKVYNDALMWVLGKTISIRARILQQQKVSSPKD